MYAGTRCVAASFQMLPLTWLFKLVVSIAYNMLLHGFQVFVFICMSTNEQKRNYQPILLTIVWASYLLHHSPPELQPVIVTRLNLVGCVHVGGAASFLGLLGPWLGYACVCTQFWSIALLP